MKRNWHQHRIISILAHIGLWSVVLSLPVLLDTHHGMDQHHDNKVQDNDFLCLNFITNVLWAGPFYVNAYLLTPRLFLRRRYVAWLLSLLALFGVMLVIHYFLFHFIIAAPHFSFKGALHFLLPTFCLTVAVGSAYRIIRNNIEAERLALKKEEETLKTELSFLRSQINPHFIFNILNNLLALEQMNSPELGPTILKLSSLMQYMLYDTDEELVPLARETEYLQSYIDLQRQRFGGKVDIRVTLEAPAGNYEIEPMLLIPFVENAFKHGIGMITKPAIQVRLHADNGRLHFAVGNRFNPFSDEVRDKTSGIGLGNVKRRLDLLYGNRHRLSIKKELDWFSVDLELHLHEDTNDKLPK